MSCGGCLRKKKAVITIRVFGERRMFGCRRCGSQMEIEVNPKRLSHI